MVYESDFYTTYRRPYSYSRPYVSSYSVTPLRDSYYLWCPYYPFLRSAPHLPYVAHKRLVSILHTPVRIYHSGTYLPIKIHSRVRPSILAAELNRIRYLTRPSYKSYTEDYLQSRNFIDFDDETREIRARTDNLLKKVHVFVPRPLISSFEETTSPERLRSDDYVRRIINSKNTRKDIESLPWYSTPEKRDIGSGRLACIKYAGGRPQPRRRAYYTVGDLVPGDVKSDVNLMSFYKKNRKAAEDALKKEPDDDTIKKVQDYLAKKAQEKKMEEERRAWEAAERKRILEEKELARLAAIKVEEDLRIAEIKEQEMREAERQAVIAKAEAARHEAERIVEDEKLYNEVLAQAIADEEERLSKEKEKEEERKKQEEEDDKMANLVLSTTNDNENDNLIEDTQVNNEYKIPIELTERDDESKPYEVDNDEDTKIEEDGIHVDQEIIDNPFIEAGSAITSEQAINEDIRSEDITEEPIIEYAITPEPKVRKNAGGEQGFDWSQYEDEKNTEDIAEDIQTIKSEQITDEEPQQFNETTEIESQSNDEALIVETEINEDQTQQQQEQQVTDEIESSIELQNDNNTEETIEVYQVIDENKTEETKEEQINETEEHIQDDEVRSEKSSLHELGTEEEYDHENEIEE